MTEVNQNVVNSTINNMAARDIHIYETDDYFSTLSSTIKTEEDKQIYQRLITFFEEKLTLAEQWQQLVSLERNYLMQFLEEDEYHTDELRLPVAKLPTIKIKEQQWYYFDFDYARNFIYFQQAPKILLFESRTRGPDTPILTEIARSKIQEKKHAIQLLQEMLDVEFIKAIEQLKTDIFNTSIYSSCVDKVKGFLEHIESLLHALQARITAHINDNATEIPNTSKETFRPYSCINMDGEIEFNKKNTEYVLKECSDNLLNLTTSLVTSLKA